MSSFTGFLLADLLIVIITAAFFALLFHLIKQPIMVGYVFAGIFLKTLTTQTFFTIPDILKAIANQDSIAVLSEIGLTLLLFTIGMELDIRKLKSMGIPAIILAFAQTLITAIIVVLILHFGFNVGFLASAYIGLSAGFSSTLIAVRILYQKHSLDSLHGRLMIGVLVIEDIAAVFALSLLPNASHISLLEIGTIFLKGVFLIGVSLILIIFILPPLIRIIVRNPELVFIGTLALCFAFAGLAFGLGFSLPVGAFIAGIFLANTPYSVDIVGKITPLRDFFVVLFFVSVGMGLSFIGFEKYLLQMFILFFIVLICKPILFFFLTRFFGYSLRTSFFVARGMSHASEFGLILAGIGLVSKQLDSSQVAMISVLILGTMGAAVYLSKFDQPLFELFSKVFKFKDEIKRGEQEELPDELSNHVIVFGMHTIGVELIRDLSKTPQTFVVVDFHPEKVASLVKRKVYAVYGDLSDPDIYEHVKTDKARIAISTINAFDKSRYFISQIRRLNKKAVVMVTANNREDALDLYKEGADYVALPDFLAGEKISNYLAYLDSKGIRKWGKINKQILMKEKAEDLKIRSK